MRTIKRKRIFGGRKSIHKKKHKRSFKKFRGGVERNYLESGTEIYKVKGILGYQKPGPLYKDEGQYDSLKDIEEGEISTTPNLFKGNIKHDNGNVILTDYKPLISMKIGWIYGGHFGNIVIYSSKGGLTEVITKLNGYIFKKDAQINKTLFVREIDEEVIKFCERKKELKNEISPWESMTQEFDFTGSDLTDDADIDSIFKDILKKYYLEKIDGISREKIKKLLDNVKVKDLDIETIRTNDTLLGEYKNILQRRNKSFVKEFSADYIGGVLNEEKWDAKVDQVQGGAQGQQYPDIYKKINALRLKQEIIYKELTDIFSTYMGTTYPFNIEYFSCNLEENPNSNDLINRVIKKFNINTPGEPDLLAKFNNRVYKSISKIMYILQIFNPDNKIYRDAKIVRYKPISGNDLNSPSIPIDDFFPNTSLTGFRDFTNGYVINSMIDPVIMARLLSFNIQIKATILLSYSNDTGTLAHLDVKQENGLYKNIDYDELRLKIKLLKINNTEITSEDLEKSLPTDNQDSKTKLEAFTKVLNEDGDIEKDIYCKLNDPFVPENSDDNIINLRCKCKIYKKEVDAITDIMIYLYDEKSSFNQDLIKKILIKPGYNDSIYTDIKDEHLESFYSHLLPNGGGHEHNYYDITF